LLAWLASLAPSERDSALEERLGIAQLATPQPIGRAPPGPDLVGYHASGVAPIVRALLEVPVLPDDVVVDLGAGLGKVVMLVRLLTGATARGIEIQPELARRAREAAARLDIDVEIVDADVRDVDLSDGTVFFLYLPFTGPVLVEVLRRLESVASRREIVICTLGLDLDRHAPWLVRRPIESFWLEIYDSGRSGRGDRGGRGGRDKTGPSPLPAVAEAVAFERAPLRAP
jgi:hypothetical protein